MSERLQMERDINRDYYERSVGETVCYGNEIQLLHLSSQQYLNGRVVGAKTEKNAYHFDLSSSFSGGMVFKFIPKFKLRLLGEPVQYNDSLIIQNVKLQGFINFSAD